jgi:hypothetical protein
MTDVLLLSLGCLFLYWSVKWPWQWYRAAQVRVYVDYEDEMSDEEIVGHQENSESVEGKEMNQVENSPKVPEVLPLPKRQNRAAGHLRQHELMALSSCFLSPMVVAYLLHAIRPYLSRPSGGIVSNSNLTLFMMAAEVRPILHLFQLIEARTLHLQKVITDTQPPPDSAQTAQLEQLLERISALESQTQPTNEGNATTEGSSTGPPQPLTLKTQQSTSQDASATTTPTTTSTTVAGLKQSPQALLQPQLDALNRAVRRYEKRSTVQTVVLEARLRDLDARVNDALALAAAASRNSNYRFGGAGAAAAGGLVSYLLESVYAVVVACFAAAYAVCLAPWRVVYQVYMFLLGPRRKKSKVGKESAESGSGPRGKRVKVNGR